MVVVAIVVAVVDRIPLLRDNNLPRGFSQIPLLTIAVIVVVFDGNRSIVVIVGVVGIVVIVGVVDVVVVMVGMVVGRVGTGVGVGSVGVVTGVSHART